MKHFIILAILLCTTIIANSASWKEVETVDIDSSVTIYEGKTSKGNVKYFICIGDDSSSYDVPVSKSNINKPLVLVKWVDEETGKIRYTTRSKRTKKVVPNYNLKEIKYK